MAKTKKQLRAEAVERLKRMDECCDMESGADYMKALLWDLRVIDSEHIRAVLIDLLTDERDDLEEQLEAEHALVVQLESDNAALAAKVRELTGGSNR